MAYQPRYVLLCRLLEPRKHLVRLVRGRGDAFLSVRSSGDGSAEDSLGGSVALGWSREGEIGYDARARGVHGSIGIFMYCQHHLF